MIPGDTKHTQALALACYGLVPGWAQQDADALYQALALAGWRWNGRGWERTVVVVDTEEVSDALD